MRLESFDLQKLEVSPAYISIYDVELVITFWNKACEDRFGISKADALGNKLVDLFPQTKNDYRVHCLQEAITEGKSFYFNCLPYTFSKGYYTQVIVPLRGTTGYSHVLNVVQNLVSTDEVYTKKDLLLPLLKEPELFQLHPHLR